MNVGTKSLLFGAHQFLIHPAMVLLAWHELYGWPTWKKLVCIIIHDWGYWGSPDMDGSEGEKHPWLGAHIADALFDNNRGLTTKGSYALLCLCHSRYMAKAIFEDPSDLCWADKLAVKYDPWWLYLPRVLLSGEIWEYRERAIKFGEIKDTATHRQWYEWAQARMIRKAYNKDARPAYEAH